MAKVVDRSRPESTYVVDLTAWRWASEERGTSFFFERLNRVLEKAGFDAFVEGLCAAFYADRLGRPSLRPGRYFRLLFIGYFEGLSSERGIAWRVADSLSLRAFLDLDVTEATPNHSTVSRTRRLIDVETHVAVFTWVLERLAEAGLVASSRSRSATAGPAGPPRVAAGRTGPTSGYRPDSCRVDDWRGGGRRRG